jgi:lipid-A-disaccharide synthase-like uncharacterized protein
MGQAFSIFIYVRNLMLIAKESKKKAGSGVMPGSEVEASAG